MKLFFASHTREFLKTSFFFKFYFLLLLYSISFCFFVHAENVTNIEGYLKKQASSGKILFFIF
jgi:hypothetical protein